jgi:hypothetical protein
MNNLCMSAAGLIPKAQPDRSGNTSIRPYQVSPLYEPLRTYSLAGGHLSLFLQLGIMEIRALPLPPRPYSPVAWIEVHCQSTGRDEGSRFRITFRNNFYAHGGLGTPFQCQTIELRTGPYIRKTRLRTLPAR